MWAVLVTGVFMVSGAALFFNWNRDGEEEEFRDAVEKTFKRVKKSFVSRAERTRAKRLISTSTSLHFVTTGFYLDGGSVSFQFTNQAAKEVLIFLPNPGVAGRLQNDGNIEAYRDKVQPILVGSHNGFTDEEELYELRVGSSEEKRLKELVHSAYEKVLSPDYQYMVLKSTKGLRTNIADQVRREVARLVKTLETRTYHWPEE